MTLGVRRWPCTLPRCSGATQGMSGYWRDPSVGAVQRLPPALSHRRRVCGPASSLCLMRESPLPSRPPMRQYLRRPIGQLAHAWFTDRQSAGNPQALLRVELWACKPTSASEPQLLPSGLLRSESDTGPCASVFSNTGAGTG